MSNLNWFNFNGVLPPKKRFLRGDANADGTADISDAIAILGFLSLGSTMNDCEDAADANDDGAVDISYPVRLLGFLFLGSERPPDLSLPKIPSALRDKGLQRGLKLGFAVQSGLPY